ncbi:hypothetical protein L1885_20150, partial [Streptomyces fuscigenes]|nr:hypothetical protein [Streptomyces fuscigenes]
MSRETDSSPSGPQGRGTSPYPSGTPPYGSRQAPGPQQDAAEEPAAEAGGKGEPRTETTLTTRIRINIPGSRPIPPVVVRTPVAENSEATDGRGLAALAQDESDSERTSAMPVPGAPTAPAQSRQEPEPEPAPQPEKKTSDWFAPRKPMAPGAGGEDAPGAETPAADAPAHDTGASPYPDAAYQEPFRADAFQDDLLPQDGPGTSPYGAGPAAGHGEQPQGPTAGPATGSS